MQVGLLSLFPLYKIDPNLIGYYLDKKRWRAFYYSIQVRPPNARQQREFHDEPSHRESVRSAPYREVAR